MRSLILGALTGALLLAAPAPASASLPFARPGSLPTTWDLSGFRGVVTLSVFADCDYWFCVDAVVATGMGAGSTSYFARLVSLSSSVLHPNAPYEFTTDLYFRQIRIENLTEGGLAYDAPEIDLIENQYSGYYGLPQSRLTPGRLVGAVDYMPYCPTDAGCGGTSSDNGYAFDAVGRFQVVVTPEPATLALLIPGMLALVVAQRRRGHGHNSE